MSSVLPEVLVVRLRTAIVKHFDRDQFARFASDRLAVPNFRSVVSESNLEVQLQEFLTDFDVDNFRVLARALMHERSNVPAILDLAADVFMEIAQRGTRRSSPNSFFLSGSQLFLNRADLRGRIGAFFNGNGLERLLVVDGEHSSGKTYSKLLIGEHTQNVKLVQTELPGVTSGQFEAHDIALTIADRLWKDTRFIKFDDFGQLARDAHWLGTRLVQGLCELAEPTLLIIDRFELAPLSSEAKELVQRLISSIETGECRNLWLVLIGLCIEEQLEQYDGVIIPDIACPPGVSDIATFLIASAAEVGKRLDMPDVESEAARLASILMTKRTVEVWQQFGRELKTVAAKLRGP